MRNKSIYLLAVIFGLMFLVTAADGQTARKSVSVSEVTGTFRMTYGRDLRRFGNNIKIASAGRGRLRVAMDLVYPYRTPRGEMSANMGSLDREALVAGDTAIYTSEAGGCRITLKFERPGVLRVTQNGSPAECGFGHNVSSAGTYRKISSRRPRY